MKRTISLLLAFIMIISSTAFSVFLVNGDTGGNILGNQNSNPGFTMDISMPDYYNAGEDVVVTVTVNNVNAPVGIQHVHGKMFFDTEKLGFNVPLKDKQELRNSFDGFEEWEDLTRLKTDDNGLWWVEIDAATAGDARGNISDQITDGQLVFHIHFIAKEDARGDTMVYIPHNTVIGDHYAMTSPYEHTPYVGNGSFGVVAQYTEGSGDSDSSQSDNQNDNSQSNNTQNNNSQNDNQSDSSEPPAQTFDAGDINGNRKIDSLDCLALKRAYFKRYTLAVIGVGDINKNGRIDKNDCKLLISTYIENSYKMVKASINSSRL